MKMVRGGVFGSLGGVWERRLWMCIGTFGRNLCLIDELTTWSKQPSGTVGRA
jgi:hypothetical protein